MKLFVIDDHDGGRWIPLYLHRGSFREVLEEAQMKMGFGTCYLRIRRVKSQEERDQYGDLRIDGGNVEPFEWVK